MVNSGLQIPPDFKRFVGTLANPDGRYYEPSTEELQEKAFSVPVGDGLEAAIRNSCADLATLGWNIKQFGKLPQDVQDGVLEMAQCRSTTYQDISQRYGEDIGERVALHLHNIGDAQMSYLKTAFGTRGQALAAFNATLAHNVAQSLGGPVALVIQYGKDGRFAGNIHRIENHELPVGLPFPGIDFLKPVARVFVDLNHGIAYQMPQEKFQPKG